MHVRFAAGAAFALVVGAVGQVLWIDASYGYVPTTDSAEYLEAALHVAAGQGPTTLIGYPVVTSTQHLLPAYFHPPGSLLPYALAGLGTETGDRIAIGLAVSLALFLLAVAACYLAVARLTGRLELATAVAIAFALDGQVVAEASGILTTVPFMACIAGLVLILATGWPPSRRRLIFAGIALALAHFVRVSDWPIVASIAAVLAWERRWLALVSFVGSYAGGVVALSPFGVASPAAQAALLVAGMAGFEGFAPARMDPPTFAQIVLEHWPALIRKAAANLAAMLRLFAAEGNAYVTVSAAAFATVGALRGERRLALLVVALGFSMAFIAAVIVGAHYLVHLIVALYVVAGAALATMPGRTARATALIVVAVGAMLFAGDLRELYRERPATEARSAALLVATARIRSETTAADTVISDTAPAVGLYAERRVFEIPLAVNDLPELERRVGGAKLLMLTRRQTSDVAGYPDDNWRRAYDSEEVAGFRRFATVGSGAAEVKLYRRP